MSKREKKFFRDCPKCGEQIGHTQEKNRNSAVKLNTVCNSCSKKGKPKSAEHKAKMSAAHTGILHTAEARANMSAAKQSIRDAYTKMYGEQHKPSFHYLRKWAKQIKARDNFTCNRCNTVATGGSIHAHHIVPKEYFPEVAFDMDNGVTLCSSCHRNIHAFIDKLTLSLVKLDAEGFQTHTSRFINGNKPTDVPTEYKPVFQSYVSSHKE